MKRFIISSMLAVGVTAGLRAQDVKSTTTVKSDDSKTVVYSGCVATAEEAKSYILENAVPVKSTATAMTMGKNGLPEVTTTTTTSYMLMPSEKVDLQQNVGHKVQITAVLIPAGDHR